MGPELFLPTDLFPTSATQEKNYRATQVDPQFDGDVADCAVDERSQKKFGECFGAFRIGVVPLAALGRCWTGITIQAAIPFSSQIEINILVANRRMPQR